PGTIVPDIGAHLPLGMRLLGPNRLNGFRRPIAASVASSPASCRVGKSKWRPGLRVGPATPRSDCPEPPAADRPDGWHLAVRPLAALSQIVAVWRNQKSPRRG